MACRKNGIYSVFTLIILRGWGGGEGGLCKIQLSVYLVGEIVGFGIWRNSKRGKRKEERGKRKEERGKRKEERGKRKEEREKKGGWKVLVGLFFFGGWGGLVYRIESHQGREGGRGDGDGGEGGGKNKGVFSLR